MAFSEAYIASQPAIERRRVKSVQPVKTYPAPPDELYTNVDIEGNITELYVPDPTVEGQIYFHLEKVANQKVPFMYVGVDVTPAYLPPVDGGNFTSGASLASDTLTYDGGNFTTDTSAATTSDTIDGGLYPVQDLAWKRATRLDVINGYTGRRIDPISG